MILLRKTNSKQSLSDIKRPNICNKDDTNNCVVRITQTQIELKLTKPMNETAL